MSADQVEPVIQSELGRWRVPLFIAVLAVGVLLRAGVVSHHVSLDYDEGRYLDNALNIMKGRGLATNYTSHFFREAEPRHPEDISSPVYPYLLAATFTLTGPDPRAAQLLSLLAGALVIALTFHLGCRLFDERSALLAAGLVALNPDMVIISSWSMTEMLYTAILLGILLLADHRGRELTPARAAELGLLCGALYLTRGNGLAAAGALLLWTLARRKVVMTLLFTGCFLAAISPWLLRNQQVFGSPTWTAMKNVAWSETGRDLFTRSGEPPSAAAYRAEHGLAGFAGNLARRGWRAAKYLVWGDTGTFNFICALYPLALLLTWRQRRLLPGHLCVLLTAFLLVGVPTWTGALSRYLTPVRPFMYLVVIGAAMHLIPARLWRRNLRTGGGSLSIEPARRLTAMTTATIVAMVALTSTRPMREFVTTDERGRDLVAREAARWVASQTPTDAVLLEGALLHQYAYLYDRPVVWVPTGGLEEVLRASDDFNARYLVVSAPLLRFHPELSAWFRSSESGITAAALPPGFTEVFAGADRRIVIYRIDGRVS